MKLFIKAALFFSLVNLSEAFASHHHHHTDHNNPACNHESLDEARHRHENG